MRSNHTPIEKVHPEDLNPSKAGAVTRDAAPLSLPTASSRQSSTTLPYGSAREAICFVVFVAVFVIVTAINQGPISPFYYADSIRQAIVLTPFPRGGAGGGGSGEKGMITFDKMQTIPDVWQWLQGPVVETLYSPQLLNSTTAGGSSSPVALANARVGGLRLRQARVQPNSCQVQSEYANLLSFCFGALSTSTESMAGFGPVQNSLNVSRAAAYAFAKPFFGSAPTYNDLMQCISSCSVSVGSLYGFNKAAYAAEYSNECSLSCTCFYSQSTCSPPSASTVAPIYAFTWSPAVAKPLDGQFGSIPGSGFIVDIATNSSSAASTLQQLQKSQFLDVATRSLVVEFVVFNPYLQLFNLVQILVEFPSTGGIAPSIVTSVLDLYGYDSSNLTKIAFEVMLALGVVLYVGEMVTTMLRTSISAYLTSGWNKLHAVNMALFVAAITLRLVAIRTIYSSDAVNVLSTSLTPLLDFFNSLATWQRQEQAIRAVNAVLVWIGLLKYTQMSRQMYFVVALLGQAMGDLISAVLLLAICVLGYAQAGFVAFSASAASFRTFGQAMASVVQALSFSLDYDELVAANPGIAPVYFITFYIVFILVCVNVFIAILQDAFLVVQKQSPPPLSSFPFANGVVATMAFWIQREWTAITRGRAAAANLTMKAPPTLRLGEGGNALGGPGSNGQLHPLLAMEMQALSEKLGGMMKAHEEKRGKLDGIEAMLRLIEDACMELKTDKATTSTTTPV
ncbi:hypothetical protein LEN26_015423 [Aphanomyces euteiches]|nr:hypothetical protein LEN26_015423 [Aphanomyces euteiches]KAH9188152.1 hypothetical protein AeNC1_009872 [Aphanomyces euteiches]